jgi:putative nucleotidyltransferase with HDIG domain
LINTNPNYGKGVVELSLDDQLDSGMAEFSAELAKLFSSPNYQPPALPAIALQVMALARKPKVEFDELAKTIEQDPLLAAKVMTRAQSALYAGQSQVRSLRQASVRMGMGGLRDLVVEVALNMKVFRAPGLEGPMERLRQHSLATAHCARLVCRFASLDAEYAFLCGLLHDVGIAAILVALGAGALKSRPKNPIALWSAIDSSHAEAGGTIGKIWKLPDELMFIIGNHHTPIQGGYAHPLISVLCVAQELATQIGCGMSVAEVESDEPTVVPQINRAKPGAVPEPTGPINIAQVGDATPRESVIRARDSLRLTPQQLTLMEKELEKMKTNLLAGI